MTHDIYDKAKPAKSDFGCNESVKIHEWLWSILYKKDYLFAVYYFKKMFIVQLY